LSLDLDVNAAAACRQVAANCAAEARRRKEQEQAELRVSCRFGFCSLQTALRRAHYALFNVRSRLSCG
jgi:hypothetical protein